MMRLSNVSIGTKLGLISGVAVALVIAMIGVSAHNSGKIKDTNGASSFQLHTMNMIDDVGAKFVGIRLAVRNIRLATDTAELKAANNLEQRLKEIDEAFAKLLPRFKIAVNRERAQNVQAAVRRYVSVALSETVPAKVESLRLDSRQDAARILELYAKTQKIQHEKLDPGADKGLADLAAMWKSASELSERSDEAAANEMAFANATNMAIGAVVVLILLGSAVLSVLTIARPLKAMVNPLADIAGGNFTVAIPGTGRKDEVGQIAEAVHSMAQKMSQTIAEIKASGREVTNASAEIATSTTDLSQRTEEQAASLEETSAAMEELAATVRKNAENAQLANQDAATTREVADRGGQVVAKAVDAMARIEESSRKISDIIGVIDEIARQTNLLALNAAVEAARAGEAGRGFAVVASEVRSLAQRSSQAAKDIKDLITNSNGQVKDGVDLVNKAGQSLNEIVESIKKVAVVVSEIANASAEQATGIDQINKALTQMDEVTQQNSALVEENAATAKTLEHQAKAMDEQVSVFQIGGDDGHVAPAEARPAMVKPAVKPAKMALVRPAMKPGLKQAEAREMQANLATAVGQDWKEF